MLTALGLNWTRTAIATAVAALGIFTGTAAFAAEMHTTGKFEGVKANMGTATHSKENGMNVLTLSSDFVVPDSPAPHWQVVDSKGNTYLLQRLVIKDDVFHNKIVVPAYVKDIAKVQIWCAWAEVLLGEAKFEKPVS